MVGGGVEERGSGEEGGGGVEERLRRGVEGKFPFRKWPVAFLTVHAFLNNIKCNTVKIWMVANRTAGVVVTVLDLNASSPRFKTR